MAFRLISKSGASRVLSACLLLAQAIAVVAPSSSANAVMLSDGDHAMANHWADEGADRFEGVGRIECVDSRREGVRHVATAWVIGSADTVVTAAHQFFKQASSAGEVIDPSRCVFVLYDRDQQVREIANIRYGVSPWSDGGLRNDSSYDVAILKLDRTVKVASVPAVKISQAMAKPSIELVAFQTGVVSSARARITSGHLTMFPTSQLRNDPRETRITDASRLFGTSADSTPGSSGGMYYDEEQQAAVGVHVGSLCEQARPSYDPSACFNYGLRFDRKIVAMVDTVVRDRPSPQQFIRSDHGTASPVRLAMVRRSNG